MLAYVFWHWRSASVPPERYEALARAFYASLTGSPPAGLNRTVAYAIGGASWIPSARPAYEEWYGVTGSAALDPLNDAAVAPAHRETHDAIARVAEGGTAGLYRLRRGVPLWEEARHAAWFSKPQGLGYADLYALLEPLTRHGSLWRRQMVLGAPPEFCLQTREAVVLPEPVAAATQIALRLLWP